LSYEVTPVASNVTSSTLDLRCDQGGVLGLVCHSFQFPEATRSTATSWNGTSVSPRRNASNMDIRGRPITSLHTRSSFNIVRVSVYGWTYPKHSIYFYPRNDLRLLRCFWFGDLPSNIGVIKDIHHNFFVKVSAFFQDIPSASNP
jgi:hypothetical protein